MNPKSLARKNLDRRLSAFRGVEMARPPRGWIRAIREALGLNATQLAARLGVKPPRISALEKAEVTGVASLNTLREAAEALGCTLVYAIVPETSLDHLVRAQAAKRAEEELRRVHHTMRLENQALGSSELAAERQRLIDELLAGSLRRLWQEQ
jgi:predicted DNA-binding mobile mystery protein A